ncbi:MAG TPA: methyltransferase domain-containing protein [Dongiaceae bacterium]
MVDQVANFVGSIPDHYDKGLGPIIFADYAADIDQRAVKRGPKRVLEIAAGTGIVTRQLRDHLPTDAHLTASDLFAPMLEVAQQKFQPTEQVVFQPADAMALPFNDASFDTVVCQFGLMFFPDKAKSLLEVHRVLSPGGTYLFSVWDSHRHNPYGEITHRVIGSFFPDDPPQFFTVPFSCHQIDPLKESLGDAGFGDIKIEVLRRIKVIPDLRAFAMGLVLGNPIVDQIRARGDIDPMVIVDSLFWELERAFGSAPAQMPLQAIIFVACT